MVETIHILIALDNPALANRPIEYIAKWIRGCRNFTLHLVHALEPLPPQLLESPGSEDPAQEEKIEQEQARQQDRWMEQANHRVAPLFNLAKSRLAAADVPEHRIQTHVLQLDNRNSLVDELIKAAHEYHCETIIVGYTEYPWIKEQFNSHIAEKLVARADDLAVCIVK